MVTVAELPLPLGPGQGNRPQVCLHGVLKISVPRATRLLGLGNFRGLLPVVLGESRVALAAGVCLHCEQGVQLPFGSTAGWY